MKRKHGIILAAWIMAFLSSSPANYVFAETINTGGLNAGEETVIAAETEYTEEEPEEETTVSDPESITISQSEEISPAEDYSEIEATDSEWKITGDDFFVPEEIFRSGEENPSGESETSEENSTSEETDKVTDLSECLVQMEESYLCTGSEIVPDISITTPDGITLIKDQDYKTEYENNLSPGTAKVIITALSEHYTGSVEKEFRITLATPKMKTAKSLGYNSVEVSWSAVPGAKSYIVYYKGYQVNRFKRIKTGYTKTSIVHKSSKSLPLVAGQSYTYVVRAVCDDVVSDYDRIGKAVTPKPGTAQMKSVKAKDYNKVILTWTAVSGASGYGIYYRKGNEKWSWLTWTKSTSCTVSGSTKCPITTGVAYSYTVRAFRSVNGKNVYGPFASNPLRAKTVPDEPKLVDAICIETGKIQINWEEASGARAYIVYRKEAGSGWKAVATVLGSSKTSYTHVSSKACPIVTGKTYRYTVRSYTPQGKTKGKYNKNGIVVKATVSQTEIWRKNASDKAKEVIASITDSSMSRDQKLRRCWYYIMAKGFRPSADPDFSQEGWRYKCAYDILTQGAGNCYGYAFGFSALAKELGYSPYVIEIKNVHCFTLIDGGYWDNMGNKMGVGYRPMAYSGDQISAY